MYMLAHMKRFENSENAEIDGSGKIANIFANYLNGSASVSIMFKN